MPSIPYLLRYVYKIIFLKEKSQKLVFETNHPPKIEEG